MNDLSGTVNTLFSTQYAAGKNKIINGDFNINQRNFSSITADGYGFDKWQLSLSGGTATYSAQTFTPGAAPVAGYESKNFARLSATTGNDFLRLRQPIEDARTLAGQTATISFWAKGTNPTTPGNLAVTFLQNFGSGGSPSSAVNTSVGDFVLTGSWTRYSLTVAIPSVSGKTFGTTGNSRLEVWIGQGSSISTDSWELDLWGVQLEAGSVATPFQTATGTIQGELAACQRYYYRTNPDTSAYGVVAPSGFVSSTTNFQGSTPLPVAMRARPTAVEFANLEVIDASSFAWAITAATLTVQRTTTIGHCDFTIAGATAGRFGAARGANSTSAYLAYSAEL
jgi:hypothetical protein